MMTDEEFEQFHQERFAEIEPKLKDQVIAMLKEELSEDAPQIREAIQKDPITWATPYHFMWGMSIRNLIREKGFTDDQFPSGNLDDYYVKLVEAAVQL